MNILYRHKLLGFFVVTWIAGLTGSAPFDVDYHLAMANSSNYSLSYAQHDADWSRARYLYDQALHATKSDGELRIPKIIHQIWLGSPLPEQCRKLQATWKKHHPDWEYYLWTEQEIEALGLVNKKRYDAARNYGEKADIVRYEVLYRFGGLYIDTDFECLKAFDPLHYMCDFYTGVAYDKQFIVFNGLIGSRPGHPILKACVDMLLMSPSYSSCIMTRTGPYFFTERIRQYMHSCTDHTVVFPVSYFYPWPNNYLDANSRPEIERWFKPETFAVHHWHRSWCL